MSDYHINVFYSDEDGGYIADTPDLKSCSAFGATPEEAVRAGDDYQSSMVKDRTRPAQNDSGAAIPARDLRCVVAGRCGVPASPYANV